jgi:hypothetical protein
VLPTVLPRAEAALQERKPGISAGLTHAARPLFNGAIFFAVTSFKTILAAMQVLIGDKSAWIIGHNARQPPDQELAAVPQR